MFSKNIRDFAFANRSNMVRERKIDEYGQQVVDAMNKLLKMCKDNMFHSGDLLVCEQNGSIFANRPLVGPGEEGNEYIPRLNTITGRGIGETTKDDDYLAKNGNDFFDGTSEFELSITREMRKYQDIWENSYFLRLLTQMIHLLNGEHYDWHLNVKKNKSNLIEHQIIKKSEKAPLFHSIISFAYNRQVRNAIAHSQYQLVQGGILLNNIEPKDGIQQGLSFEQWERMFIQSYCLVMYTKESLRLATSAYFAYTKITGGGIPIIIPTEEDKWEYSYLYPDSTGRIWRFNRIDH